MWVYAYEWRFPWSPDEGVLLSGAGVTGNFEGSNVGAVNLTPLLHKSNAQALNHWVISRPNHTNLLNFSSEPVFLFFATWIHWTKYLKVLVHFCLQSPYSDCPQISSWGGGTTNQEPLSTFQAWAMENTDGRTCRHTKPVVSSPRHTRGAK